MIARSYLYVPADNAEMLAKSSTRGSDALIVDFEDSVSVENKSVPIDTDSETFGKAKVGQIIKISYHTRIIFGGRDAWKIESLEE